MSGEDRHSHSVSDEGCAPSKACQRANRTKQESFHLPELLKLLGTKARFRLRAESNKAGFSNACGEERLQRLEQIPQIPNASPTDAIKAPSFITRYPIPSLLYFNKGWFRITTTPQIGTNNTSNILKMVLTPTIPMAVCFLKFLFGINMINSITHDVHQRADHLRNRTIILLNVKNDLNPKQCFCFSFCKCFIHNAHKF